jgi:8-oxo-dGTP diphosphatase
MGLVNAHFLVGVTSAAFDERGRILLYHHTYRRHPWGMPAGWLKRRESLEACAVREAWEEGRLRITPVAEPTAFAPPGRRHVEAILLCRYVGGEFRPSLEVDGFGLYARDSLPEGLLPAQRPLIEVMARRWAWYQERCGQDGAKECRGGEVDGG